MKNEVYYSPQFPHYTLHDIFVKGNSDFIRLFTTKYEHWAYEKEYRVILADRGNTLYDLPGPITSIIFGLRTSDRDEMAIRRAASRIGGIRFGRCCRIVDKFAVRIEDAPQPQRKKCAGRSWLSRVVQGA